MLPVPHLVLLHGCWDLNSHLHACMLSLFCFFGYHKKKTWQRQLRGKKRLILTHSSRLQFIIEKSWWEKPTETDLSAFMVKKQKWMEYRIHACAQLNRTQLRFPFIENDATYSGWVFPFQLWWAWYSSQTSSDSLTFFPVSPPCVILTVKTVAGGKHFSAGPSP